MKKIKIIVLILSVLVIFNDILRAEDLSTDKLPQLCQGCYRRYVIGIVMKKTPSNQVIINDVIKGTPAEKAGLKAGDILKSVDNKPITVKYDMMEACSLKSYGDEIELEIIRNNSIKKYKVKLLIAVDIQTFGEAILKYIYSNKKMSLVVIVSDVKYIGNGPSNIKDWKDGVKYSLLTSYENIIMSGFRDDDDFTLIDRNKTAEILKEISLSQTGLTSSRSVHKIGELLNATHILFIEFSRYQIPTNPDKAIDQTTRRLIEIESGKVLSSDQIKLEYSDK